MKTRNAKSTAPMIAIIAAVLISIVVWAMRPTDAERIAKTKTVLETYASACSNYYQVMGKWPDSIDDLISNPSNILFFVKPLQPDGWGRAVTYSPFSSTQGYRAIISRGADGREGGGEANADIEIRFGP
jgi:type II secretory pathway pseudopilin PulG